MNFPKVIDTLKPAATIKVNVPQHDPNTEVGIHVYGLGFSGEACPEGGCLFNTLPEGNWLLGFHFTQNSIHFFDTMRVVLKAGTDTSLSWPDVEGIDKKITFQKIFNRDNWSHDHFVDIFQNNEGGFDIFSRDGNSENFMKIDRYGDSIWGKEILSFDSAHDVGSVQPTKDGGFILTGSRNGIWEGLDNIDMFLCKLNYSGDIQWTKIFRSRKGAQDKGVSAWETVDYGFIVLKNTSSFDKNDNGMTLIKTDCNGDTIWTKRLNTFPYSGEFSVNQTDDNGFMAIGNVNDSTGWSRLCLAKLSEIGDIVWVKNFDECPTYDLAEVHQAFDGGCIFATNGITHDPTYSNYSTIVKLKPNGDILWSKTIENSVAKCIEQINDNEFIVAGSGVNNIFLFKISGGGEIAWFRTLSTVNNYQVGFVRQTNDGGYIIAAKSKDINCIGKNLLIKTDENGNVF